MSKGTRNQNGIGEDKSQILKYDIPEFFAFIRKNILKENQSFSITDHWHDELEFVYLVEGSMKYVIEGETVVLHGGEGVFVNSRRLHVGLSDNGAPSVSYCVILHPMLLNVSEYIIKKYIEPVIQNKSVPYLLLSVNDEWGKIILNSLEKMYLATQNDNSEMEIIKLYFEIWQQLYPKIATTISEETPANHHMIILKDMIGFIHEHYREKISLEDICYAGGVGKTMGTSIFNTYVNKTPGEFLKDYRIHKSIKLLKETDLTVTEICYETGFSGASYFAETFKKNVGISPLEYRKSTNTGLISHFYDLVE